jgi:hypothetical protein
MKWIATAISVNPAPLNDAQIRIAFRQLFGDQVITRLSRHKLLDAACGAARLTSEIIILLRSVPIRPLSKHTGRPLRRTACSADYSNDSISNSSLITIITI